MNLVLLIDGTMKFLIFIFIGTAIIFFIIFLFHLTFWSFWEQIIFFKYNTSLSHKLIIAFNDHLTHISQN